MRYPKIKTHFPHLTAKYGSQILPTNDNEKLGKKKKVSKTYHIRRGKYAPVLHSRTYPWGKQTKKSVCYVLVKNIYPKYLSNCEYMMKIIVVT